MQEKNKKFCSYPAHNFQQVNTRALEFRLYYNGENSGKKDEDDDEMIENVALQGIQ